jgi:6-phosphogluconolactonase
MASNDHRQVSIKENIKVVTISDAAALAKAAAERVVARIAVNVGRVAICLAGGSSPKQLYQLLATEAYRSQIPWHRVHWFVGDERFVPATDPLSNIAMMRDAFLDRCAPAANIHPIPTDSADPKEAAHRYERQLKSFYGADELDLARPLFDVVLLGVGPDGHTASLFPGTAVLEERARWVAAVLGAKDEARITLTYPALESSRHVAFLVAGPEKRSVLASLRRGDVALPAARLQPAGTLRILADAASLGT